MKNTIKDIKGFTLIELMIVIAIIGILLSVIIPNIIIYKEKSKNDNIVIIQQQEEKKIDVIRDSDDIYSEQNKY